MSQPGSTATASYREVFGNREFIGLIAAQVLSECGDQIARVGLAVLILARTDNPFLAALAFVVGYVPASSALRSSGRLPTGCRAAR